MAKFSGASVKAGQTDALTQEAAAAGPVQQLQERVPQASDPTSFAELMDPGAVDTTTQVEDIAEGTVAAAEETAQIESERIPPPRERIQDTTPRKWEITTPKDAPTADGGLFNRARAMAETFSNDVPVLLSPRAPLAKAVARGQATPLSESAVAEAEADFSTQEGSVHAAFNRSGALTSTFNEQTRSYETSLDPRFLSVGSAVVENFMSGDAFTPIDPETGHEAEGAAIDPGEVGPITRAQGNAAIGRQIHQEYSRLKNAEQGLPTDQYADISQEEATVLGHAFKKMYHDVNPEIVKEVDLPGGRLKAYELTAHGAEMMRNGKTDRERMFPKHQVRPSKVPTKSGQLPGEVGRTVVRQKTGAVKRGHVGDATLKEATRNMNKVANIVDTQRMRILFSTILPVLADQLPPGDSLGDAYSEINNIGESTASKFRAAEKTALSEGKEYDAAKQMEREREKIAQQVRSIAMERKGANYLTYFIQSTSGRITPQQLHFNPTTSKAVRFVTRNAVPAKATPGSRIARNLEEMYAMMLVPSRYSSFDRKGKKIKVDQLLPHHRIESFNRAAPELEKWGDRLAEVLEQSMTDADAEAIAAAIEAGTALDDPNFPRFNPLALDPARDGELIAAIKDKGEDGPHFIDGLIDAAKYIKAKREGRPYHSYFNAYVDGKTNGIASNALQVGSENLARATGVIRDQSDTLLDDGDIRDQLEEDLKLRLRDEGFPGKTEDIYEDLYTVAEGLFGSRDLHKATTMTFPYGKEMASFKEDIQKFLGETYENNLGTPFSNSVDNLKTKMSDQDLIKTLHSFYIGSLEDRMDSHAIKNRKLMRSAAMLHAITDQLFTIKTATGFEIAMGGTLTEGFESDSQSTYSWKDKDDTQRVGQYKDKYTSAAEKWETVEDKLSGEQVKVGTPGQLAYGQSVTSPVHSLDAATVALSVTGDTWKKLSEASNGNPYVHTIYDAFKFDAMGFDVGVREVNKNWFDAGMNWSYLKETFDSTQKKMAEWKKQQKQLPQNDTVNVGPNGDYRVVGHMLAGPKALTSRLKGLMEFEEDAKQSAKAILDNMRSAGYEGGDTMTRAQLVRFVDLFISHVRLSKRLDRAIKITDARKHKLRKAAQNNPVLQYYAH